MLSSVNDFFQFSFGKSGSLLNLLRRHPHFLKLARNSQGFFKRSFLATFLLKTFCDSHQFILMLRQTLSQRPHKFR